MGIFHVVSDGAIFNDTNILYKKMLLCKELIDELLQRDMYIARSDYTSIVKNYKEVYAYFEALQNSNILPEFCRKFSIDYDMLLSAMREYHKIEETVDGHNCAYVKEKLVSEKEYLDHILSAIDDKILLDSEQRRVVLNDEDYTLVVAGAGAGKTTTIAAKVKYLVEKKNINPSQILIISFTNKAVLELRQRINRDLKIGCPITTFHSTGNAILRKVNDTPLKVASEQKLYYLLQDYFKKSILNNERLVNNLILFFGTYFDAPFENDEDLNKFFSIVRSSNYSTLRSELGEYIQEIVDRKSKKKITLTNEVLRSREEVVIANFLYLNGIDYVYEPTYKYNIRYARKPYTPDFLLKQGDKVYYLEHFGISEDGINNRYSEDELRNYKKAVNDKILLHKRHNTNLIYTFSKYNDGLSLTKHLEKLLVSKGFQLKPRNKQEILEKLISEEENKYVKKLLVLLCRFITNFKTNGYDEHDFLRMYNSTSNVRTRLFLNICEECYLEYQRYLNTNHMVDFQDMINYSAKVLYEMKEMKQELDFKYIIVDEYQDISRQRFDLTKALSDVTKAKIIAVGDDWQSIYAFSGANIDLFTKFKQIMGYAKVLKIVKTYRNSQEVIDIAGGFIQKNDKQIKKSLESKKRIDQPVIIYTYDDRAKKQNDNNKTGTNYHLALGVQTALEQIIRYNLLSGQDQFAGKILLLGRFNFDGDILEKTGLFQFNRRNNRFMSVKYPKLQIDFMTVHSSKGLGYDNVIVMNGKNGIYGFPSKIEDDPVLKFVLKSDDAIDYAEERRLFYVAMTRTKNRVYFVAPKSSPSEFLLEIKKEFKNVMLVGDWNENSNGTKIRKTCPLCGYPLKYSYKTSYGLKLYMCTNEPEACGFITNDLDGGKMSIMKCNQCNDGYLVVRKSGNYFLGCTNYKEDGYGCNNLISKDKYYKMFHLFDDAPTSAGIDSHLSLGPVLEKAVTLEDDTFTKKHWQMQIPLEEEKIEFVPIDKSRLDNFEVYPFRICEVIETILLAIDEIGKTKYFGVHLIIDYLRMSRSKKIIYNHLDKTKYYGSLLAIDRDTLEVIIEWLISYGYLLRTKGKYPVVHPTYDGRHIGEIIDNLQLRDLKRILYMEKE